MVSIWWILVAFLVGGYCGAILVGMLSMAKGSDTRDGPASRMTRRQPRAVVVKANDGHERGVRRRRHHDSVEMHF